jgi:hypothetical protein
MRAPSGTLTTTGWPASVFNVRLFPAIAVTVPSWRAAGAGAAAGACAISPAPHVDNAIKGSSKLALSAAVWNTANPFNIVLPLEKINAVFAVVASG